MGKMIGSFLHIAPFIFLCNLVCKTFFYYLSLIKESNLKMYCLQIMLSNSSL